MVDAMPLQLAAFWAARQAFWAAIFSSPPPVSSSAPQRCLITMLDKPCHAMVFYLLQIAQSGRMIGITASLLSNGLPYQSISSWNSTIKSAWRGMQTVQGILFKYAAIPWVQLQPLQLWLCWR